MSQRIEDTLEVLSTIMDLYDNSYSKRARSLRIEAEKIVASRGVAKQTIHAHLVDKDSYHNLTSYEIDQKIQSWLNKESDDLLNWLLKRTQSSVTQSKRINDFFANSGTTPKASDIEEPKIKERVLTNVYRVLRDTALARRIKVENDFTCEVCHQKLLLYNEEPYAEAHHVKPLGGEHDGPDQRDNILCVCPNCHVLLDYGAIKLDDKSYSKIGSKFIQYHNQKIYQGN
jgi:predicted restriction endonuclease